MKSIIKSILVLFFMSQFGKLFSQSNHYPIKIEEKTEKYTETNSKYGSHIRTRKQLFIIYNDSTSEIATQAKLKEIFKSVPLAEVEYKKFKANNIYMAGSIPLFALGFWGTINVVNGKEQDKNKLIALFGLASGATVYEVFEYRKKRNTNRMIAYCNNYWKNHNPQTELKNILVPDVLKAGIINENTFGLGLIWDIGE